MEKEERRGEGRKERKERKGRGGRMGGGEKRGGGERRGEGRNEETAYFELDGEWWGTGIRE